MDPLREHRRCPQPDAKRLFNPQTNAFEEWNQENCDQERWQQYEKQKCNKEKWQQQEYNYQEWQKLTVKGARESKNTWRSNLLLRLMLVLLFEAKTAMYGKKRKQMSVKEQITFLFFDNCTKQNVEQENQLQFAEEQLTWIYSCQGRYDAINMPNRFSLFTSQIFTPQNMDILISFVCKKLHLELINTSCIIPSFPVCPSIVNDLLFWMESHLFVDKTISKLERWCYIIQREWRISSYQTDPKLYSILHIEFQLAKRNKAKFEPKLNFKWNPLANPFESNDVATVQGMLPALANFRYH